MAEKILIVDDDVETLRLVGLMLQRQGYEIVAANNGTQAIGMARSEKPDLIVLDVMMPDIDGYQVTNELRKDPDLFETPILMFTAKSQVDDKVAGYDAGVDDYLTKPVHPAELVAHIKALLSRTRIKQTTTKPLSNGYIVGIIGCKGGLGASTLAINIAASYAQSSKSDVVAVEVKPGQGTWASELGFPLTDGLSALLKLKSSDLNKTIIEQQLTNTTFGVRLLLASDFSLETDYATLTDRLIPILQHLAQFTSLIILDIGTPFMPGFDKLCGICKELYVVTEPQPSTIKRTKVLFDELRKISTGGGRMINLVLYNRVRSDVQMSSSQVSDLMGGTPIATMIPPAPELAYQSVSKQIPLIVAQPEGLITQQIKQIMNTIKSNMSK